MATNEQLSAESAKILDEILKRYGLSPQSGVQSATQGASAAMGAASDAMAANRSVGLQAEVDQQRLRQDQDNSYNAAVIDRGRLVESGKQRLFDAMIAREQEGRASGHDAFLNLQRAEYVANKQGYQPKAGLPSFGFGPRAASEAEKQGANAFKAEMMKRLSEGNPIDLPMGPEDIAAIERRPEFRIDPALLRAGGVEQALGIGSGAAGVAGQVPTSTWKKIGKGALKVLDWVL